MPSAQLLAYPVGGAHDTTCDLLGHKIDLLKVGLMDQVGVAMQAVEDDVKAIHAKVTATVPAGAADAVGLKNKLEIAKNVIKMLMQPYQMAKTATSKDAGGDVKETMTPFVTCARQMCGLNLDGNGFTPDEIADMFGPEPGPER